MDKFQYFRRITHKRLLSHYRLKNNQLHDVVCTSSQCCSANAKGNTADTHATTLLKYLNFVDKQLNSLLRQSKNDISSNSHRLSNFRSLCCLNNISSLPVGKHSTFGKRNSVFVDVFSNYHMSSSPLNKAHIHCFHTSSSSYQNEGKKNTNENDKDDKIPMFPRLFIWVGIIIASYTMLRLISGTDSSVYHFISWNEFYHDMLAKGEVQEVIINPEGEMAIIRIHEGAIIKGKPVDFNLFAMKIPDPNNFEEKIRKAEKDLHIGSSDKISVSYHRDSSWTPLIFMGIITVVVILLARNMTKVTSFPNPSDMFANERKARYVRVDAPGQKAKKVNFKDVAGLKEAKMEIMEFVDYLKTTKRFKDLGGKIPKGALLLGPPGCGKTLLARAVASEAKVPFLALAGSEFVEVLGGLGAARVRDLFKEARKKAPCIIYIDEIDAIGRKRGGSQMGSNVEEEHTLNQLLVEMDGMGTQEGVIMIAATNRADILDKALLRPGRFDRHITIDLPTLIERLEIFEMYLKKLKLSEDLNISSLKLSQLTPGMTGADIANICNESALHAARYGKKSIDRVDFDYAIERAVVGVAKRSRLSPSEKHIVAYHECGHALVGWLLKYTDALLKISIVPRTNRAMGFIQYTPSDQKLYSAEELFERMAMALGGRAAEAVVFNHVTTGAQDDLKRVTKLAYDQIQSYGMNKRLGYLSFPNEQEKGMKTRPYSKKLAALMDEEAKKLVAQAYQHAENVLIKNKEKLHLLATALQEREVLTYEDIEVLIGPPPYGKKDTIEQNILGGKDIP